MAGIFFVDQPGDLGETRIFVENRQIFFLWRKQNVNILLKQKVVQVEF